MFSRTNSIGSITPFTGDLLNFVMSNKKLSIMSKFVEIPVNEEKCIVNIDALQSVQPSKEGCIIHLLDGNLKGIKTEMPYEELRKLILDK